MGAVPQPPDGAETGSLGHVDGDASAVAAFAASILTAPRAGRPGTAPAFAAALTEVPGNA